MLAGGLLDMDIELIAFVSRLDNTPAHISHRHIVTSSDNRQFACISSAESNMLAGGLLGTMDMNGESRSTNGVLCEMGMDVEKIVIPSGLSRPDNIFRAYSDAEHS
jgi:hypothetical protein